MALILLEGLDRTGKSTIAKMFEKEGYEIIHLSAPDKKYTQPGYTGNSYLDDMVDLLHMAANRDIVLDRTHYGELIWPQIYNRSPMLTEDDIEILREVEESIGVRRIMMHDPDVEAHWKRCVDNNEPLTRPQFLRARTLYERMAKNHGFEKLVLSETPAYEPPKPRNDSNVAQVSPTIATQAIKSNIITGVSNSSGASKEQVKLEKANAINDVLSKRIVKGKSEVYDEIELEVRNFLNKKLGTILGSEDPESLSQDEIFVIRAFVKRLKEKDTK